MNMGPFKKTVEIIKSVSLRMWGSGSVCIFIAALIFSFANLQVKLISGHVPSMEIIFFRAVGSLILTLLYAYSNQVKSPFGSADKLPFLIFRGVTGTTSMVTYYFAIQYLPLSEAVTIAFLNPLIIVPWAYFLFKDKVGWRSVVGIIVALVGVVLIQRPAFIFGSGEVDSSGLRTIGLLMAFNSAFFTSLSFIQIRLIGNTEDPITINLYYYIISIFVAGASAIFKLPDRFVMPQGRQWGVLLNISLLSFLAQVFTARGFQIGKSAIVASVNFMQVFYSLLFDVYIFKDNLNLIGVIGSISIFIGIVLVNVEKQKNRSDQEKVVNEDFKTQNTFRLNNNKDVESSLGDPLIEDQALDLDDGPFQDRLRRLEQISVAHSLRHLERYSVH